MTLFPRRYASLCNREERPCLNKIRRPCVRRRLRRRLPPSSGSSAERASRPSFWDPGSCSQVLFAWRDRFPGQTESALIERRRCSWLRRQRRPFRLADPRKRPFPCSRPQTGSADSITQHPTPAPRWCRLGSEINIQAAGSADRRVRSARRTTSSEAWPKAPARSHAYPSRRSSPPCPDPDERRLSMPRSQAA